MEAVRTTSSTAAKPPALITTKAATPLRGIAAFITGGGRRFQRSRLPPLPLRSKRKEAALLARSKGAELRAKGLD